MSFGAQKMKVDEVVQQLIQLSKSGKTAAQITASLNATYARVDPKKRKAIIVKATAKLIKLVGN